MSQRCVVLVGMMGAGKTEVGRELADRLGYEFLDTDKLLEKRANKRIRWIVEEEGEPRLRELERETIESLRGEKGKVIATGGGAYQSHENRAVLNAIGLTVYLKASPRELYARIKNDSSRPLLNVADPKAEVTRLLAERKANYEAATVVVDTEDLSVEEVVDHLIDELAQRTLGDG